MPGNSTFIPNHITRKRIFIMNIKIHKCSRMAALYTLTLSLYLSPTIVHGFQETENSTVTYDQAYFTQFSNIITARDMVERVPGGIALLNMFGGGSRGFGTNQDFILIDGKRLTGKDNDSSGTLGRISSGQVLRIELIRGASPDVKVSGQENFINVVLKDDPKSGSGTWEVVSSFTKSVQVAPGGKVSYSGKSGKLDYFVEAAYDNEVEDHDQSEQVLNGNRIPISLQNETADNKDREAELAANFTYNIDNGDILRFNGKYSDRREERNWDGFLFDYDVDGSLIAAGESIRFTKSKRPSFELGGDYEAGLTTNAKLKLIGLYSSNDLTSYQSEDMLITTSEPQVDFDVIYNSKSTEAIFRPSLEWQISDNHLLEIGNEVALNTTKTKLDYFELVGNILIRQEIDNAITEIDEKRSESFMNYSWKISNQFNLEASLTYEYSKISHESEGEITSQSFKFVKPSIDLRYDLTKSDQLQISLRRNVNQLNFNDFASSVSIDDELIAGNSLLTPQKAWTLQASYEHRFADDLGQIKASVSHNWISDNIQAIEIVDDIPGVGNNGAARRTSYSLNTNMKMDFIGLPNLTLEGTLNYRDSEETDYFTGRKRDMNGIERWQAYGEIRYDLIQYGMTMGATYAIFSPEEIHDIDEILYRNRTRTLVDLYIEKRIFERYVLKAEFTNIINPNEQRIRELFDDGVAGGVLTGVQDRSLHWGSQLVVSLRGTF